MGVEELGINLAEVDGQAPVSQSSKKKSGGDGFLGLCSIGTEQQNMSSALFIMMLLLAPLVASLRPIARPQVVRVRKKSK
jgi:hypothetical protein